MCSPADPVIDPSPLVHDVLLVLQDYGVPQDINEQVVLLIEAEELSRNRAERGLRLERNELREELKTLRSRQPPERGSWWSRLCGLTEPN